MFHDQHDYQAQTFCSAKSARMRFVLSATAVTVELIFASWYGCTPQLGWRQQYVDSHFGVRYVRGKVQTIYVGRPAQCAKCGGLRGQCYVGDQLSVRNTVVPVFGGDSGVPEDQRSQASTDSTWPPRSVHDEPFNSLQSCQPRRVWWSLSCIRGLWKRERAGPDDD